jgi:hypothetical protein
MVNPINPIIPHIFHSHLLTSNFTFLLIVTVTVRKTIRKFQRPPGPKIKRRRSEVLSDVTLCLG